MTVANDGELVWSDGFGAARKAAGGAAAHSIASISKPFTAMAVMSLVEAGLLDLDASVNDYLGDQKLTARLGDADNVTLRLLLNHTCGLPGRHSFFYEDEDQRRLAYDESIRQFGVLVNPPGEIFEYSNYGFGIVEHVIEPLGLKNRKRRALPKMKKAVLRLNRP